MPRRQRWITSSGEITAITPETPAEIVRLVFGRRLAQLIVERGWNQSELSRRAGIARDSVSTYVRCLALPDPVNAKKIADALGMTLEELNPAGVQANALQVAPTIELRQTGANPGMAYLRVNLEVPLHIGIKILTLLEEGCEN